MKLTREGKRFFIATVLIAIAALNTANNLIYLVFSMMLSILFLAFVILRWNLKRIILKVSYAQPLFAKGSARINIALSNDKKHIPSYSIKVWIPEKIEAMAYFPEVSCLSEIQQDVPVLYERRGIYRYGNFFMESSFPFLFLSKRIISHVEGEVIVYPEIKELDRSITATVNEWYETAQTRIGKGDEFSMIREFRYGDDWRRIHWKASAKATQLLMKEYAMHEPKKLTIILDNLKPHDEESFEKAVSLAASMTDKFLNEGFFIRLLTCRKIIPFGNSKDHLFKILDILAAIEGQDSWECPISDELEGTNIVILGSEGSPLSRFITDTDMVIYASTL
jgi:uncharacterized protein (DUF58 family)